MRQPAFAANVGSLPVVELSLLPLVSQFLSLKSFLIASPLTLSLKKGLSQAARLATLRPVGLGSIYSVTLPF